MYGLQENAPEHLLALSCPMVRVSGKLQQPNSGRMANRPDPSGMKVGSPHQAKKYSQLRCLLRAKEIWNE